MGREIRRTDVRNASTHTTYNAAGQVEKQVNHLGQSVRYTYYPANHVSAGRVWKKSDAAGKTTETEYDSHGRVSLTGGSASYPVRYGYDNFGVMKTMTTYGTVTATTTWIYDDETGLLTEKRFQGQSNGVLYKYRPDGKLASRTWRRGDSTLYGYSSFGDLNLVNPPGTASDVTFSNFDLLGRPATVTEASGVTSLGHNLYTGEVSTTYAPTHALLPSVSVVMKPADSGRPGGYEFSKGGTPLLGVTYGYDIRGRLKTVTTGNDQVDYQYYPGTGILHQTTHSVSGEGIPHIETRHVDLAGRITGVVTTVPDVGGRRVAASSGYLYNARGQRERLTREDGGAWHYGYNDRGEVTSGERKLANGSLAAGMQLGY
ncbi:MAG: hypothetical protein EOP84_27065, partial [Verrucomicrobiaceae bacterium]